MLMSLLMLCDSYRIQTCNLLIRSQMLYSVELRSRAGLCLICECKVTTFFSILQIFCKIFSHFFENQA